MAKGTMSSCHLYEAAGAKSGGGGSSGSSGSSGDSSSSSSSTNNNSGLSGMSILDDSYYVDVRQEQERKKREVKEIINKQKIEFNQVNTEEDMLAFIQNTWRSGGQTFYKLAYESPISFKDILAKVCTEQIILSALSLPSGPSSMIPHINLNDVPNDMKTKKFWEAYMLEP
jgi:hypothetical protein